MVSLLDSVDSIDYVHNRVNLYTNVVRYRETELGNYYFARNHDYLTGMAKTTTPLYGISVDTGLATVYANNSAVPTHDRLTVRKNLTAVTLTRDNTMFMSTSQFLLHCPTASAEVGSTYQLSSYELISLPLVTNLDYVKALLSIRASCMTPEQKCCPKIPPRSNSFFHEDGVHLLVLNHL